MSELKKITQFNQTLASLDSAKNKDPTSKSFNRLTKKLEVDPQNIVPTKIINLNQNPSDIPIKWVYQPMIYSVDPEEQVEGPQIRSWVDSTRAEKLAFFRKYNIKIDLPNYTDKDYRKYIEALDKEWTKEETDHLFQLLEIFEGNFALVFDRYSPDYKQRSVAELKERVFVVCQKLAEIKEDKALEVYRTIKFDKQAEIIRRTKTEQYLKRTEEEHKYEAKHINEIKNLEMLIKRKERENKSFKKLVAFNKDEKNEIKDNNLDIESLVRNSDEQIQNTHFAFNRGAFIKSPIPNIPPLTNKKLELALQKLGIPEHYIATERNLELHDVLRKKLLKLFSLNYFYQQKEEELKNMMAKNEQEPVKEGPVENGNDNLNETESNKKIKTE